MRPLDLSAFDRLFVPTSRSPIGVQARYELRRSQARANALSMIRPATLVGDTETLASLAFHEDPDIAARATAAVLEISEAPIRRIRH